MNQPKLPTNPTDSPVSVANPALAALADRLPAGAGLGLRPQLWHDILDNPDDIDFIELVVDDYLELPLADACKLLRPIQERFPIVAHGVSLSVASAEGIDVDYVERVARFLDALAIEIYSEHLSFRSAGDVTLGQFVPVPFTSAWADIVAANVRQVQTITGRTMLLENVTYLLGHPREDLGEPAFVSAVVERASCGLLLDITNVLINGANLGYTPKEYIAALPSEHILQAHMAGGHIDGDLYIDSHGHPVPPEAFDLLAHTNTHTPLRAALLERDKHFPPFAELRQELQAIREALARGTQGPEEAAKAREQNPLAYEVLRTPPVPSQPLPPADELPPEDLQRELAKALSTPGGYKALRATPPDPTDTTSDAQIHAYLLSFAPADVKAFAKILQFKRRELITGLLHGTCHHLEKTKRLVDLLGLYFMEAPEQGLSKLEDTIGFANFLRAQDALPTPLKDLALHEQTTLSLRATPFRFWHPLTQRKTITLSCHPRDLDKAIHSDLPTPLDTPIRVRYIRKRKGIWVEPLGE